MTDATQPDWDPRAESVLQNQRQAYDKMRQSGIQPTQKLS